MIERLLLKDFQCHINLDVALDPHVSVFYGKSDLGKSAVLRALYWLLLNQPSGEGFIGRWGKAKFAYVKAMLEGKTIARKRGSGHNLYYYRGQELASFGKGGVPQQVRNLANVSDFNFQSQHSSPFWFTLTPGQVSQELNEIINLGVIDSTLRHASQTVRKTKAEVDVCTDRIKASKKRKRSLAWAPRLDRKVRAAEASSQRLEALENRRNLALGLIEGVKDRSKAIHAHSKAVARGLIAIQAGHELQTLVAKADSLREIVTKLDQITQLSQTTLPDLTEIETVQAKLVRLKDKRRRLDSILFGLSNLEHQLCLAEGILKDSFTDLEKISKGVCPTCLRPLPKT